MNVIMGDPILPTLKNKDTHCGRINQADMMNVIVRDHVPAIHLERFCSLRGLADPDTASAEVAHLVAENFPTLTASPEFQGVACQMCEHAIFDNAIDGSFSANITTCRYGCLSV